MIEHLQYIRRQLAQRGEQIDFERLYNVKVRKVEYAQGVFVAERYVPAYNQYLFLINTGALPVGTKITGDTNVVWIEPGTPQDLIEEFSGLIHIDVPPAAMNADICQVLFYEVVPVNLIDPLHQ